MTEKELMNLLQDLLVNVEEDCPSTYFTKHLRLCLDEVRGVLENYMEENK